MIHYTNLSYCITSELVISSSLIYFLKLVNLTEILQEHHQRMSKKKEGRKHREKKEKHEKRKHKKAKKELTDEQIERTYTGLDRELAEEFIDNTMEPGLSIQRAFSNSFEQDSF